MISTVDCPHCHKPIVLTEALTAPIRASLSSEYLSEAEKLKTEATETLKAAADKEAEVLRERANMSAEVEKLANARYNEEKPNLTDKIREEFADAIMEKQAAIESRSKSLDEARDREMLLLDEKEKLARKIEDQDLDKKRAVSEALDGLRTELDSKAKDKENQQLLEMKRLSDQLADAQRQLAQRSMEVQGEAAEIDMVTSLRAWFPFDSIEDVPKGIRGADCVQRVMNHSGKEVGAILWERKKTKGFQEAWIQKLKDDVTESRAHFGIILTDVLPKDIKGGFDSYKGVWFCSPTDFEALSKALRASMIKEHGLIKAQEGKQTHGEILIDYVTSPLFRQRIESISETFKAMRDQLQTEKKAMNKIWAAREGQNDRVFDHLAGLAGDIESKIEKSLGLASFELKALPEKT